MDAYDVLEIISDIRTDCYSMKSIPLAPSEKFYYHSYSRWALDELERALWKNRKTKDVLTFLENYRAKMDHFSCLPGKDPETHWMFSIAYEMVTFVIDEVICVDETMGYQQMKDKMAEEERLKE